MEADLVRIVLGVGSVLTLSLALLGDVLNRLAGVRDAFDRLRRRPGRRHSDEAAASGETGVSDNGEQ